MVRFLASEGIRLALHLLTYGLDLAKEWSHHTPSPPFAQVDQDEVDGLRW